MADTVDLGIVYAVGKGVESHFGVGSVRGRSKLLDKRCPINVIPHVMTDPTQ